MDKTPMRVILDMDASKGYMSKSFYMGNTGLHTLPKFSTTSQGIIVGNSQLVPVMFIILITCSIQDHVFEIFTMVTDIHWGIDLVFGLRNMTEIEHEISTQTGPFSYIPRIIYKFPTWAKHT